MYFELQLSAAIFTRIIRNRLKALPLCVDREVKAPDGTGTYLVVNQVVVGNITEIQREQMIELVNGSRTLKDIKTQVVQVVHTFSGDYSRFTVPFLQVRQEVVIDLVKPVDLDANGVNPTKPSQTLRIYPVFNVSLTPSSQTQGGGPLSLSYSLAYVDFGPLLYNNDILSQADRNEIVKLVAEVQLPPITVDLEPLSEQMRRPVSAINAGIACDPNGLFVALRVEFGEPPFANVVNQQFFEVGPTNLLAGKDWAMLTDANVLTEYAKTKAKSALASEPKVKLRSGPNASWDPSGPAINVSAGVELMNACPFFIDDIDIDADVNIHASFSVPPNSPGTLRTHFNLHAEPSNAVEQFGCAITGALLWPFIGPVLLKDEDIGEGMGAYFGGLAGGPLVVFIGIFAAIETKGLSRDISQDLGKTCTKQDDKNYECNDVVNIVMQLSPPFKSILEPNQVYGVPEGLVYAGSVRNLPDRSSGSVTVTASSLGWTLFGTCKDGFEIVNSAQIEVSGTGGGALCKAYVLSDPLDEFALSTKDGTVTVTPRFKPNYVSAPYECRVRVITTAGVRTITFPPPTAITDEERQHLVARSRNFEWVCQKWKDTFKKPEMIGWELPGFVEQPSFQLWQVAVHGLPENEIIRVVGLDGATILTASPSRAGVAHMTMLFPSADAPSRLSLELSAKGEENEGARTISVQQMLFEYRASLPVRGPIDIMMFESIAHSRQLFIVDADQEMRWDVSAPLAPALLSSIGRAEHDHRDSIIVQNGRYIGAAPTLNFLRALEVVQDRLGFPEVVGSPRIGGIAESLYVRTKQSATLFDISNPEEPREVHSYQKEAWFEGVALGGELMARYNADLNVVDIYYAVMTKTV